MMENNFELLLAGMLDEQRTLSNINVGITKLQSKLKEINISLNIGNIDKQIVQIGKSFDKLNTNKSSTNIMSNYQKALEDTIHQYKVGMLDLETYSKRMQDIIYGKNSSTYKTQFTGLSDKSQEKYITALNQAYTLQGKALNEVYNTNKKIQTEDEKRLSAVNSQTVAIQKMQNALSYSTSKYSSGVDQNSLTNLQSQLSALSQLNPQTNEYAIALKNAQLAVGEFNKQLASSVTSENQQSKATTDQIIAIDKLKTSLNTMSSAYGQFVDSSKLSGIKQMISDLERMNPTSVSYRNQLKLIQNETQKLGTTSKQAFKSAQDAISDTTSKTTSLGLAFRTLSQFFLIGSPIMLARKAFSELTSTINEANKAITDIRIVTGMSGDSANDLLNTYNELGKTIGATTSQILEGSVEWFRAGKTVAETQELVQASIIGSKMAGIESAEMTELLTSSLNGYKLEAQDAISVIDKMVGIDNAASTSLEELATAMSYTANGARNAGVDMSRLLGYIGTVSEVTRMSAETIGNSFKTMFTRYGDLKLNKFNEDGLVTSDVIKTFDTIGIKVKENETTWRDFGDVIDELAGKWNTLSEADQNAASKALAGTRQREQFLALMENYNRSVDLSTVAVESNGLALDRYNNIYLESTSAKLDKLKATLEGVFFKTLNSGTVNTFIGGSIAILEFTDACGGLIPVVIGLTTAIIALRTATKLIEFGNTVGGIKSISDALVAYQMMTEASTAATIGLSLAQKLLIGGGIVAGVMAIGYGINYFATSAERARESIANLSNEISNVKNAADQLSSLGEEFEKLKSKSELNTSEAKRLYEVQNQIKEILPNIGGYYDENGNFLISQVSTSGELLEIEKEKLRVLREQLALESEKALNSTIEKYKKQQEILENIAKNQETITRYRELMNKMKTSEGGLDSNDSTELQGLANQLLANGIIPAEIDKTVSDAKVKIQEASGEIHNYLINMLTSNDGWEGLGDSVANGIRKTLSEMSGEDLENYATQLKSGSLSTEDFINTLKGISTPVENASASLSDSSDSTSEYTESVQSLQEMATASASKLDILKVALEELNQTNDISGGTMDKLIKKYPELADEITTVDNMYGLLSKKVSEQSFDKATQDIADLTSVLEDLQAGNGLTSSSVKKISDNFPELLGYMNNEANLTDAINNKMVGLKDAQNEAYRQMLMNSEEYFKANILGNQQMATSMQNSIQSLFKGYGLLYNGDLKNWKSLASGKADIEQQLINGLGQAWEEHFQFLSNAFSKSATGSIMETSTFDRDSYAKLNLLNPTLDKGQLDAAEKMFNEQQKKYTELQNQKSQALRNASVLFDDIKFDPIDIKVGGTKSSSSGSSDASSYIKSLYQSMVDSILSGGDDVTKAISLTNAKIENAQLLGDLDLEQEQTNKLADLFKQERDNQATMAKELDVQLNSMRKDLSNTGMFKGIDLSTLDNLELDKVVNAIDKKLQSATGNEKTRLEGLKSIIEDVGDVYLSTLEQRETLSTAWWEKENQRRQQEIDNIKRLSEIDKQRHDDKLKQIELEQMYMTEDSAEYAAKEQEKIALLIKLQEGYQETISQLKAQGKSEDQADIREYINLYTDAEIEILNVKKAMAEKERALQIKASQDMVTALEKQKDAIEERTELVMDMIKKEQELRKKAIDEEISGYEKIIEARKKTITDEQDATEYNEELSEKQKVVTDLESKLLTMQDDNSESSKAQRLKLEEELAKARKDVNKFQLDKITDDRLNALDEELEGFKDEKQKELDEISGYLEKEGQIRTDAMKRIEQEGKSMYDSLKKYNSEYGNMAESELETLWATATTSVNGYIDSNKSLLEIMKDITAEINKQTNLQKTLGTNNWQTFVPSTTTSTSTTSSNKNLDVITKMMENSNKWKSASKEEQVKLAQENQKLGNSINAFYDDKFGVWYTDSAKKKRLFDVGIYHNGGIAGKNMSIGGVSINPNTEIFSKLMIGEPITTQEQASNFITKSLPNLMKAGKNAEITLNIAKLIDVAKMDNNTDIEDIMDRAVNKMMKQLNNGLSSIGLRPNLR